MATVGCIEDMLIVDPSISEDPSWPNMDEVPDNLKPIESWTTYMRLCEENNAKNPEVDTFNPKSMLCVGIGQATRTDVKTTSTYLHVLNPQHHKNIQKIWNVSAMDQWMKENPHSIPFFFTIKEKTTSTGKPFFQASCCEASAAFLANLPKYVIDHIAKHKTLDGSLRL